jgi:molybdopterin converting factor small subunit
MESSDRAHSEPSVESKNAVVHDSSVNTNLVSKSESEASIQFALSQNLVPHACDAITPDMLTLIDLDQGEIDMIVQTVPGGCGNVQDIYPLAPAQEGMLFHHLLNEASDTYVVSTLLELQSRAQLDALLGALQKVIDRHDILRSAVLWEDLPRPVQVVYRNAQIPVEELVLDQNQDTIEQLKERMTPQRQKWNLRQAPLMRLQIAANAAGTHWYAILQLHHVVCDHGSLKVVASDAMGYLQGLSQSLPEPIPYRTHVAQALAKFKTQDAEAFFRSRLATIDETTAPFGLVDVRGDGTRLEA